MAKQRDPLAIEIGARLKLARERKGYSQAQAALRFGLSESTYRSYELGDSMVPMAVFRRMPEVYGLPLEFFLGLPERPPMSDEARLIAAALDDTQDPELHRISAETVTRNWQLDRRMRGASE